MSYITDNPTLSALKKQIIDSTNKGLLIYAYILSQYYTDHIILILAGYDCHPAKSPFADNRRSLIVFLGEDIARHYDLDNKIPPGDVFDFASLHFGLSGEPLCQKIYDLLYLDPNKPLELANEKIRFIGSERTIYNPPCLSFFEKPISNIFPSNTLTLVQVYSYIKRGFGDNYTQELRKIKEAKTARAYKARKFDYVTFSGVFSKRSDQSLIRHSGLLTIDFDHIENVGSLRTQLLCDRYFDTELLFISPSGDGIKWIIPIDLSNGSHQDYFDAVSNYIKSEYDLTIDQSGKDVSRACFLPFDPEVFINPKYLGQ